MRKKRFLRQKFRENWKFAFSRKLFIRSIQMRYQMKVLDDIYLLMPIIEGKIEKNFSFDQKWLWSCEKLKTWFFFNMPNFDFFLDIVVIFGFKNFFISITIEWNQKKDQWRKFGPPSPPPKGGMGVKFWKTVLMGRFWWNFAHMSDLVVPLRIQENFWP